MKECPSPSTASIISMKKNTGKSTKKVAMKGSPAPAHAETIAPESANAPAQAGSTPSQPTQARKATRKKGEKSSDRAENSVSAAPAGGRGAAAPADRGPTPAQPEPSKPQEPASGRPAEAATSGKALRVTTIQARVDVGFGNQLFVRGEGPGLSWDRGLPAQNTGADVWVVELEGAETPVVFKCLINDTLWAQGEDCLAPPGATVTVEPRF